jgi:hypothetical protein
MNELLLMNDKKLVPFDAVPIFGMILVLFVLVGDIAFMFFKSEREGTTWSELIRESLPTTTLLPWAFGVWLGHWFPIVQKVKDPALSSMVALSLSLVVVNGGDLLMKSLRFWGRRRRDPLRLEWLPGLLGIIEVFGGLLVGALTLPIR